MEPLKKSLSVDKNYIQYFLNSEEIMLLKNKSHQLNCWHQAHKLFTLIVRDTIISKNNAPQNINEEKLPHLSVTHLSSLPTDQQI